MLVRRKGAAGFCTGACQGCPVVAQRMAWSGMVFVEFALCRTNTPPTVFFAVPKLGAGVCIDLTVALCCIVSITKELDDLECDSNARVTL